MTAKQIQHLARYSPSATQFTPKIPGLIFLFDDHSDVLEFVATTNIRETLVQIVTPNVKGFAFVEHETPEEAEAQRMEIANARNVCGPTVIGHPPRLQRKILPND